MKRPDRIYHLAEASNWPLIQRDGLLSASRLMRASGLTGADRDRLERAQRPAALDRSLYGMSSADWYATINARVFFWLDKDRLNRQRAACESRPQFVLIIHTAALIATHEPRIAVTPINTGSARRKAAHRGPATFVPLAE